MIALLHLCRSCLTGVSADEHVVALRHLGYHGLRGGFAAVLGITANVARLRTHEDKIVIRG